MHRRLPALSILAATLLMAAPAIAGGHHRHHDGYHEGYGHARGPHREWYREDRRGPPRRVRRWHPEAYAYMPFRGPYAYRAHRHDWRHRHIHRQRPVFYGRHVPAGWHYCEIHGGYFRIGDSFVAYGGY